MARHDILHAIASDERRVIVVIVVVGFIFLILLKLLHGGLGLSTYSDSESHYWLKVTGSMPVTRDFISTTIPYEE